MPVHPTLGRNLRWYRDQRGITGPELAHRAQISKGFLSDLEQGKANVGYEVACRIAAALGIHVSLIWDHREPPFDKPERAPRRRAH